MDKKVLIVEDQFVEANDIKLMLLKAGYEVCGMARDVEKAIHLFEKELPSLVLVDIFLKGSRTGIELGQYLNERSVPFIYISANSNREVLEAAKATQPAGFIVKPFREKDLLVTLEIAQYRQANNVDNNNRKENLFKTKISELLSSNEDTTTKLLELSKILQTSLPFDYVVFTNLSESVENINFLSFLRIGFDEYQKLDLEKLSIITGDKKEDILKWVSSFEFADDNAFVLDNDFATKAMRNGSIKKMAADRLQMKSNCSIFLKLGEGNSYVLDFYSRRERAYGYEHVTFGKVIAIQLRYVLDIILNMTQKNNVKSLTITDEEKTKINSKTIFHDIIGSSHLLLNVFDYIEQVAPVDTSVLILGESGTGKEKIADRIHQLSPRKNEILVKINCGALPANLIESELFGHEKGAFTGATERRIGKFEMANNGTLFLDEIGEIPLDLQTKLLRVLQEREIERIGGSKTIKVNVRIVAATNRNLEREVAEGRFRLDLYYRLNIFPITVPALRDRLDDIPLLTNHFITLFNKKAGKDIKGISNVLKEKLLSYHWPGNIRELENLMERAVLLSRENVIKDIDIPNNRLISEGSDKDLELFNVIKTIDENERDHILSVLKRCNNKIYGPGGAAELLDVPPTTLNSKMKRLGIKRGFL